MCNNCRDFRKKIDQKCEIEPVGGFLKSVCISQQSKLIYKCPFSETTYESHLDTWDQATGKYSLSNVTALCENDERHYQACGFNTPLTNTKHAICGGHFEESKEGDGIFESLNQDNEDHGHDEHLGSTHETISEHSEIVADSICDGKCDTATNCEDEATCGGYNYGLTCERVSGKEIYVPVHWICNGQSGCSDEEDEADCSTNNTSHQTCIQYYRKQIREEEVEVPILAYTRCAAFDVAQEIFPYCKGFLDQTNCNDPNRIGGYCEVGGVLTSISKAMVCYHVDHEEHEKDNEKEHDENNEEEHDDDHGDHEEKHDDDHGGHGSRRDNDEFHGLCDDNIENICFSTSESCVAHKHKLCDGINDCPDGSDESVDVCKFTTAEHFECERGFGINKSKPIPLSWINDGKKDCKNGLDEGSMKYLNGSKLEFCEYDKYFQETITLIGEHSCQNVFLCPGAEDPFVKLDLLCDGVESCGTENYVCKTSRDSPTFEKSVVFEDNVGDLCSVKNKRNKLCEIKEFVGPYKKVFGVKTLLNVPSTKVPCNSLFGEYYVYLSCMGLCITDSKCPLKDEPLKHDSCQGQYPDRVYTLSETARDSHLTFVTKSDLGYQNKYFECDNSRCIEFSKVCDLVNDCGDMSDEKSCSNHLLCKNTENDTNPQLISLNQKCNGIFDCSDLSDECNSECGKKILEGWLLKITCWITGLLAILFNVIAVVKTLSTITRVKTGSMFLSKTLISLVAWGDLMIGIYLIVLSIYDSIIFGEKFCENQAKWLSGTTCSAMGVISTFGSQLSLFSMTALSISRAIGITLGSMAVPSSVNKVWTAKVVAVAAIVVTASLSIALIPLAPSLEDYFVQGVFYDDVKYKLFTGLPNKEKHVKVIQAYYSSSNISAHLTWKEIGEKVDGMFTQNYGELSRRKVHFYGNDGVCLFKYFVRSDDPTRSRVTTAEDMAFTDSRGNIIVWLMLAVNFFCFVIIAVCYGVINNHTLKSLEKSGQAKNQRAVQKNQRVQNRVTLMIITDFLCWVPFIIISALHNRQAIDATNWYVYFAMIVLPINSVINPLLYDNTVTEFFVTLFRRTMMLCGRIEDVEMETQMTSTGASFNRESRLSQVTGTATPARTSTVLSTVGFISSVQRPRTSLTTASGPVGRARSPRPTRAAAPGSVKNVQGPRTSLATPSGPVGRARGPRPTRAAAPGSVKNVQGPRTSLATPSGPVGRARSPRPTRNTTAPKPVGSPREPTAISFAPKNIKDQKDTNI